ncbi:MAG: N-acetylmuramoyl-L-alanine amidase [Acidobacteriota bacterium]
MAKIDRLKRRLVQQAVRENLASLEDKRHIRSRGRLHVLLATARSLFFVFLPAALFASTLLFSNRSGTWSSSGEPLERRSIALPRPTVAAHEATANSTFSDPAGFATPVPIDSAILPLTVRTVILDPGHGGQNQGTKAPEGLVEKEITLDIAKRVRDLLEQRSYQVLMTRDKDLSLSLRERAQYANQNHGDIFVSIHVNWIENRELRGVETFYLGPTDDPYLAELAARENQQSGYSLADFKQILQQVYAGVRQEESRRLAETVQDALFRSLHNVNTGVRDRGVKSAPFGVLIWTEMPAILAEVSCVSNQVEARLLMTPIYRQFLAEAIVQGIDRYSQNLSGPDRIADDADREDNGIHE